MTRFLVGLLAASSLVALDAGVARAATFSWAVSCGQVVVGPVTVLDVNFNGSVDLAVGVPVTTALLPTANLIRRDNPNAPAGVSTATLSCTLTFGAVVVPFTRSLTLTVNASGTGDLAVGAVTVSVNLGTTGVVTLSAPAVTTIGYDKTIPIIVVPLLINTIAVLTPPGIPTLSTWAMLALVALMLGSGLLFVGRRPRRA